jgi:hypothetical protein
MVRTLHEWGVVVIVSAVALPLAGLLVWWLAPAGTKWRRLTEVGVILGTLPWVWMILTPRPSPGWRELVPIVPVVEQFRDDPPKALAELFGNLLVFAAFGFFGTLRWNLSIWPVLGIAAAASALLETLQWLLDLGRVSSVNDVLLNAAGAGLASLVARGSVPAWIERSR